MKNIGVSDLRVNIVMLLCIESTTPNPVIGFFDKDIFVWRSDTDNSLNKNDLHDHFRYGLEACDMPIANFTEIVLDIGPGGLIATRSGVSFANGLAHSLGIKIVPVRSLDLMFYHKVEKDFERVITARKSNNGNFFMNFFLANRCIGTMRGLVQEALEQKEWLNKECLWLGPTPAHWLEQGVPLGMTVVNYCCPDLDVFSSFIRTQQYKDAPRLHFASPDGQG